MTSRCGPRPKNASGGGPGNYMGEQALQFASVSGAAQFDHFQMRPRKSHGGTNPTVQFSQFSCSNCSWSSPGALLRLSWNSLNCRIWIFRRGEKVGGGGGSYKGEVAPAWASHPLPLALGLPPRTPIWSCLVWPKDPENPQALFWCPFMEAFLKL